MVCGPFPGNQAMTMDPSPVQDILGWPMRATHRRTSCTHRASGANNTIFSFGSFGSTFSLCSSLASSTLEDRSNWTGEGSTLPTHQPGTCSCRLTCTHRRASESIRSSGTSLSTITLGGRKDKKYFRHWVGYCPDFPGSQFDKTRYGATYRSTSGTSGTNRTSRTSFTLEEPKVSGQ